MLDSLHDEAIDDAITDAADGGYLLFFHELSRNIAEHEHKDQDLLLFEQYVLGLVIDGMDSEGQIIAHCCAQIDSQDNPLELKNRIKQQLEIAIVSVFERMDNRKKSNPNESVDDYNRWLSSVYADGRNTLFEMNVRLFMKFALKLYRQMNNWKNISEQDLLQGAAIGLFQAINKFEPVKGVKFSTYAVKSLRKTMQRYSVDPVSRHMVFSEYLNPYIQELYVLRGKYEQEFGTVSRTSTEFITWAHHQIMINAKDPKKVISVYQLSELALALLPPYEIDKRWDAEDDSLADFFGRSLVLSLSQLDEGSLVELIADEGSLRSKFIEKVYLNWDSICTKCKLTLNEKKAIEFHLEFGEGWKEFLDEYDEAIASGTNTSGKKNKPLTYKEFLNKKTGKIRRFYLVALKKLKDSVLFQELFASLD